MAIIYAFAVVSVIVLMFAFAAIYVLWRECLLLAAQRDEAFAARDRAQEEIRALEDRFYDYIHDFPVKKP